MYYIYFIRRYRYQHVSPPIHFLAQTLVSPSPLTAASNGDRRSHSSNTSAAHITRIYVEPSLMELSRNFTFQSIEKLILTEGEKLILVLLSAKLTDQGVYSLVTNIGSMVARFIFQPMEETAFTEFSLLLGGSPNTSPAHTPKHSNVKNRANTAGGSSGTVSESDDDAVLQAVGRKSAHSEKYHESATILSLMLKLVITISILLLAIGPNYSYLFFHILYGSKWSHTDAPTALSYYFLYILVISLNGLTEAYVFATISAKQLKLYNVCMLVFSAIYLLACVVLVPYGVTGLILANTINMMCRIVFSCFYIYDVISKHCGQHLALHTFRRCLPSMKTIMALIVGHIITHLSYTNCKHGFHHRAGVAMIFSAHTLMHIAAGGVCTLAVLLTIYQSERQYIRDFIALFQQKKKVA